MTPKTAVTVIAILIIGFIAGVQFKETDRYLAEIGKPHDLISVYCSVPISNQTPNNLYILSYPAGRTENPIWFVAKPGWSSFIFTSLECEGQKELPPGKRYLLTVVDPTTSKTLGEVVLEKADFEKKSVWVVSNKVEFRSNN